MNKREKPQPTEAQAKEQALSVETVEARIKLLEAQQAQIQQQGAHYMQEMKKLEVAFVENTGALRNLRSLLPQPEPSGKDAATHHP